MTIIDVNAPVVEATLLEDRAQVVRRGTVTLPAGVSVLAVTGVAPVLADKTVTARLSGARVVDVRVERETVAHSDDPRRGDASLRLRLQAANNDCERLDAALALVERERDLLVRSAEQAIGEINQDAAAGRADADGWQASVVQIAERQLAIGLRIVDLQAQQEIAARLTADLTQQLHAADSANDLVARLLITVDVPAAATAEMQVTYVVPGACWRPWHTAQLDGDTLTFTCTGCIWQRTGEAWNSVRLRLSTDRPSLGVEPPRLSDDLLSLRAKDKQVVVETRDQTVETTGGGGGRPAAEMPGIDDGGEVRVLDVQGLAIVPSDGRPHRFPLFSFTAPVTSELLVHAELVAAAILKTTQANTAAQPLLAGPVDLIRNGGLVGRASILYVAPGARFDLGWGPDAAVRVHRQSWTQEEKSGTLSSWQPTLNLVDLSFSNVAGTPRILRVVERILVSEVQQVKAEIETATVPAVTPDADGMCSWSLTLPPGGHAEVKLRWRLLKQGDVVGV